MIPGFYEHCCRILNNSKRRVPSKQDGLQLQYSTVQYSRRLRAATFSKYNGALVSRAGLKNSNSKR